MTLKFLDYFEWPTVTLIACCYSMWFGLVLYGTELPAVVWITIAALNTTLHLSILHEVVHGHPTSSPILNRFLVLLPISWVFPFERFRDTHIQHHKTGELTDPLDDPESWYVYAHEWQSFGAPLKLVLNFNNTLAGRILIGPIITLIRFIASEMSLAIKAPASRRHLISSWLLHFALCSILVLFVANYGAQPLWAVIASVYLGISILLIRTFLEHQSAEDFSERTVIIEQTCPIACLFLFNNFHALHHKQPGTPWYRLPGVYQKHREQLLLENNYYFYRSYSDVFRRYFFKVKEPVVHPHLKTSVKHQPQPLQIAQS